MLKKYPTDFSNQILNIIRALSFTDGKHVKLVGSYSLRDQVYAGDVDSIERIPARSIRDIVERFQNNVKQLVKMPFTYISDIKCGSIEEWIVVPDTATIRNGKVVGYDPVVVMKRVEELYTTKIITDEQYGMAKRLVKKHVSLEEFIELQKELRFNIVRWNYKEIIIGHKFLQDGRRYTLEEAVQAPTITKMDIVSWVTGNHFMDFEMIYVFKIGNRIINKDLVDCNLAIKKSILMLRKQGNYFKLAKRMHALARYYNYKDDLEKIKTILVGDLGRLYNIYGDVSSLTFIIENVKELPKDKIAFETDYFITRLSNISLPSYLRHEKTIMSIVHQLSNKDLYSYKNPTILRLLEQLNEELFTILSKYTLRYLKENKLFPLAEKYLL